jgi:hypothetical protein
MLSRIRAAIYIALASFALVMTVGSVELNGGKFGYDFYGDLYVTRRYRQLVLTIAFAIAGTLATWAVLGFAGLTAYPKLLSDMAYIGELRSSSLITALLDADLSTFAARVIALARKKRCYSPWAGYVTAARRRGARGSRPRAARPSGRGAVRCPPSARRVPRPRGCRRSRSRAARV